MRRLSADVNRAIENNGAVTLPSPDVPKQPRAIAWCVGAALIGSALLLKRGRS